MLRPFILPALATSLVVAAAASAGAPPAYTLTNPLGLDFPQELIHLDARDVPNLPAGDLAVKDGDQLRPVQRVTTPAGEQLWFIASIKGGKDGQKSKQLEFVSQKTTSPLTLRQDADALVISNGLYDIRLPNFGAPKANAKASDVTSFAKSHAPITGVRLAGAPDFFGKFTIESNTDGGVLPSTTLVEQGPVFITVRQHYSILFAPPARMGPPRDYHYTATLRFVADDPWVEVTETYDLPHDHGDPKDQITFEFAPDKTFAPDTICFVPWFDYIRFGGNSDMKYAPLLPREKQPPNKPFLSLQAKWTQAPGAGQDFFLTRGGPTGNAKPLTPPGFTGKFSDYDPNAPAVGLVAAFPTRWTDPYNQVPQAVAENGTTARITFPITRGSRSYALCVGPRSLFDTTGKLNSLVRRHADWTLDKQLRYTLEWPRDPAKAGPHILIAREDLRRLQADYRAGKDTAEMKIVKEFLPRRAELKGNDRTLLDLITGEKVNPAGPPDAGAWLGTRYQNDILNPTTLTRMLAPRLAAADLTCNYKPLGGPAQAAIGYIFTDLDQWPGWLNGWTPGNPNFHTDKYMVAIYAGAAMLDHPDAKTWLDFGKKNFDEDIAKVFLAPDGVGYECPGYSGYSANLQLEIARIFYHTGYGNPVAENPLWKQTANWHRNLLTPFDRRLGLRHEAPIGDTHRWTSGLGSGFGKIAKFIKKTDPAGAADLMAVHKLLEEQGGLKPGGLIEQLVTVDPTIAPSDINKLDWSSHVYNGFGAIFRTRFGQPDETFVTLKAGSQRGHYHNDELSFHFYGAGTPLALDYNCSYHPRGDHAALHNSMTFGLAKPFTHAGDTDAVPAQEQLHGAAQVGAFNSTPEADIVVAERSGSSLVLSPIYPDQAKFAYAYPSRSVEKIIHRRTMVLVKHPEGSKLADYLVFRDDTQSKEPQQLNLHLLARDVQQDASDKKLFRAPGQWDTDALVYLAHANLQAFNVGRWYYLDENMSGPDKYPKRDGKNADPADKAEQEAWQKKIHDTDGQALIPPTDWKGKWLCGEYQKWLKLETAPGTATMWVLYPQKHGTEAPKFESLASDQVKITLGTETETIGLAAPAADTDSPLVGDAWITRNGKTTALLPRKTVPKLGTPWNLER